MDNLKFIGKVNRSSRRSMKNTVAP
jgi:hypothetical protein